MSAPSPRRLPAPWHVEEIAGGFVVVDAGGRRLAFVYVDADQRGANTDLLTPDEGRRVAHGIARLPDLMKGKKRAANSEPGS